MCKVTRIDTAGISPGAEVGGGHGALVGLVIPAGVKALKDKDTLYVSVLE